MPNENPFTPSFGEEPAHLAGREQIISDLAKAFESPSRRPELTTIFSGARGMGKTALLTYASSLAESCGWIAVNTTAAPGMLDDIEIQLEGRAAHLIESKPAARVSSIGVPQLATIELASASQPKSNWRSRMEGIVEQLEAEGSGLLITVDEVDASLDEMVRLVVVYQHFVREGRRVALLMAGLPRKVVSMLNDKTISFLRRAQMVRLDSLPSYEVEAAFEKTIRENGRSIAPEGVTLAAEAIDGFPFLLQLVGFRAWDVDPLSPSITAEHLARGIDLAKREMANRIFDATYQELSPGDISFLNAMLEDEGPSRTSELAKRMGVSDSQASQHRRRLIDTGVIKPTARGYVTMALPFFRDYLAEAE